jgi:hypothetical protein
MVSTGSTTRYPISSTIRRHGGQGQQGIAMQLLPVNSHAIASFRRFYSLLPRSSDSSLVILKLHLLVEEQVRAFVDERVHNKGAIDSARLDCHQAICIAESLSTEDIHANVWEAARKLNRLRNEIAHNLEPSGVAERISHVCELIGLSSQTLRGTEPESNRGPLDDLSFAVSLLYNELSLFVKRKPAEVLRLIDPDSKST